MLNYYVEFLPNILSRLAPMYKLLQKRVPWSWRDEQQQAFQKTKEALTSADVQVHYDPNKKLILTCDASPYGVGAALSLKMDNGTEHPMAFESRTLLPAENSWTRKTSDSVWC